ncbi:hypothetical protein [Massilimicrobiota sp. An80]|nr:hypothetical protein [Massilimicrobiota sp. An80]
MKKLEKLKNELFILEMKDRWTNEDYAKVKELRQQIRELENEAK